MKKQDGPHWLGIVAAVMLVTGATSVAGGISVSFGYPVHYRTLSCWSAPAYYGSYGLTCTCAYHRSTGIGVTYYGGSSAFYYGPGYTRYRYITTPRHSSYRSQPTRYRYTTQRRSDSHYRQSETTRRQFSSHRDGWRSGDASRAARTFSTYRTRR